MLFFNRLVKLSAVVTLSVGLVGVLASCVTTQKGGFSKAATTDEAVATRVAAAKQYLRNRDFEAARRHLRSAMDLDPNSAEVHDALALTFQFSGELELAEKHFKRSVSLGDGVSRYRINYASFLFGESRFEDAERQLKKIVDDSLYEKREAALVMLGLSQLQLLQVEEAQRSFERALVLNPRNPRVLRELAILSYEAKDYPASWRYLQALRKVVARPDAETLLLGIELAQQLQDPDSEASFALALKNLYPDSREYQSYLRRKQYQ